MNSGLASWLLGGALALAFAAQATAPQTAGAAPADAAVDPATVQGQPAARDYHPPEGITFRAADFYSENVRLTAQWFYAAGSEGRRLPTVILAHDWGGTAANLRQDAVDLARAGYLVMLFDYRGWGDSDGRVTKTEARGLRGYIDPFEQTEDWFNAVSYAVTDPMVDTGRIGILGAELSGGHVLSVAAHEPRIKALVSLVSRVDGRPSKPYQPDPARVIAEADAAASRLAAGQASYPADRARAAGAEVGAPVGDKLVRWAPVDQASAVTAPALFVLAQGEELFSNASNGQRACERVQGPRKLVMLARITHDDIYGAARQRAIEAAIDWFDRYLKPPGAPTRVAIDRKAPERGECNPSPVPPKGDEDKDGSGEGRKAQDTSGRWS